MSTRSPDPIWTVPDQTQTHPRPSRSIYSIPEPICSIPKGMLHRYLLSKHSQSGEHHSWTHLTIPDEPKTSQILSTNPELACSPLNLKTQYMQPWSGKAWMPSTIPSWVLFLFSRTYYYLSLLTLVLFPPVSPSLCQPCICLVPYHTLSYHYTLCPYHLRLHPDHSFQVPISSTSSISSLCTPCIP